MQRFTLAAIKISLVIFGLYDYLFKVISNTDSIISSIPEWFMGSENLHSILSVTCVSLIRNCRRKRWRKRAEKWPGCSLPGWHGSPHQPFWGKTLEPALHTTLRPPLSILRTLASQGIFRKGVLLMLFWLAGERKQGQFLFLVQKSMLVERY